MFTWHDQKYVLRFSTIPCRAEDDDALVFSSPKEELGSAEKAWEPDFDAINMNLRLAPISRNLTNDSMPALILDDLEDLPHPGEEDKSQGPSEEGAIQKKIAFDIKRHSSEGSRKKERRLSINSSGSGKEK